MGRLHRRFHGSDRARATARGSLLLSALFWVAGPLGGCGEDLDAKVQDHLDQNAATDYRDCGATTIGPCGRFKPDGAQKQLFSCLLDAFNKCQPARGRITQPTVEGDPIVSVYFVEPAGSGERCRITRFADTTADSFGPQEITRRSCVGLVARNDCGGVPQAEPCAVP